MGKPFRIHTILFRCHLRIHLPKRMDQNPRFIYHTAVLLKLSMHLYLYSLDVVLGNAAESTSMYTRAASGAVQDKQCASDYCSLWWICSYPSTTYASDGFHSCI